jgi:hypothetical protein
LDPCVVSPVDQLSDHLVGLVKQTGDRGGDQQPDLNPHAIRRRRKLGEQLVR